jgi:hypothetical protein
MVKHCCFGVCSSNSKRHPDVNFIPFIKPTINLKRAERWVHLCGRADFSVDKITRDTYICHLHFSVGQDLNTHTNPLLEPYPAKNEVKRKELEGVRKRNVLINTANIINEENISPNRRVAIIGQTEPPILNLASEAKKYITRGSRGSIGHIAVPVVSGVWMTNENDINFKGI